MEGVNILGLMLKDEVERKALLFPSPKNLGEDTDAENFVFVASVGEVLMV